jgi:hypothetical protein
MIREGVRQGLQAELTAKRKDYSRQRVRGSQNGDKGTKMEMDPGCLGDSEEHSPLKGHITRGGGGYL